MMRIHAKSHRRVVKALHNFPELLHEVPDDVDARVLLRDGLITHRTLIANVDLVRLGQLLPPPLLHQCLVAKELIQLGMH